MHNEETHRIHTKESYQIIGIDYISSGLGHLGSLIRLGGSSK